MLEKGIRFGNAKESVHAQPDKRREAGECEQPTLFGSSSVCQGEAEARTAEVS